MFRIAYEGAFSSLAKTRIEAACKTMLEAVEIADKSAPQARGIARKKKWFGSIASVEITRGLKLLHRVLNDNSRTITFVNASKKKYWCAPEGHSEHATPPPPPVRRYEKASVNAMVYNISGVDFDDPDTVITAWANFGKELTHAGSGMRLYLYQGFFNSVSSKPGPGLHQDLRWITLIITHELTHKVLNTHDIQYGPANCLALAVSDPEYTLLNADTWACYITSFVWPELFDQF